MEIRENWDRIKVRILCNMHPWTISRMGFTDCRPASFYFSTWYIDPYYQKFLLLPSKHWTNGGLMLSQRRRRWPNNKPPLVHRSIINVCRGTGLFLCFHWLYGFSGATGRSQASVNKRRNPYRVDKMRGHRVQAVTGRADLCFTASRTGWHTCTRLTYQSVPSLCHPHGPVFTVIQL